MLADKITEVIFIGMPGPTHHYGGLSADNVASSTNRGSASNPQLAALQAISLARRLRELGLVPAILPPQLRPHLPLLAERFTDVSGDALIVKAAKEAPELLESASSSSAMWSANAATVSPIADNKDGKLHLTTANLHTNLHRRIEAQDTHALLCAIFAPIPKTIMHPPLPDAQRDEGAANHMRLAPRHFAQGLNVFVYSKAGRQSLEACQAIASAHGLMPEATLFIEQNPKVIEAGVFHNDVIAVSNEHVLLVHEDAYAGGREDIARIGVAYKQVSGHNLTTLIIERNELSVQEAVQTYFFNSQILTKFAGNMAVIAPKEVQELFGGKAMRLFEKIARDSGNPIDEIITLDLRQSMRNGGGPACLRLRVAMNSAQLTALHENSNVLADEPLLAALETLVKKHYREELYTADVADPALYHECKAMREELLALMRLKILPPQ